MYEHIPEFFVLSENLRKMDVTTYQLHVVTLWRIIDNVLNDILSSIGIRFHDPVQNVLA